MQSFQPFTILEVASGSPRPGQVRPDYPCEEYNILTPLPPSPHRHTEKTERTASPAWLLGQAQGPMNEIPAERTTTTKRSDDHHI